MQNERVYVPPPGEKVPTLPQACSKVWAALLNIPAPIKRAFMVREDGTWEACMDPDDDVLA